MAPRIIYFLFFVLFFSVNQISAQNSAAKIEFSSIEYDFGNIDAADGIAECEFIFFNKGTVPLVLNEVKPSCGCTTPGWTREPVLPGKSGSIKVNFNPKGSKGRFNKSISVSSNAENSKVLLVIKGNVLNSAEEQDEFKYSVGVLKFNSIHIAFGNLTKGTESTKNIEVRNTSDQPVDLSFSNVPAFIKVETSSNPIPALGQALVSFTFNTKNTEEWDYLVSRIHILINNKQVSDRQFTVTGLIKEDFSTLTPDQLNMAPVIAFDTTVFNFGTIGNEKVITHNYKITNKGKTDLIIRKVSASCGCTLVKPDKNILRPGESTEINTSFNPRGKSGDQNYAITVISNDPANHKKILRLQGKVLTGE